jgi:adenine-specific DNA-methyltransferase
MSANLEKLKELLAELFMLDQADLDFGIYRVMNAKRAEVTRFLETDLLPQVRQTLAAVDTGDRAQIQEELAQALAAAQAAGFAAEQAEQSPKVNELRARLAQTTNPAELENEVFSDLTNFFRRYYQGGDFLALRRYKAGVYAIPYEGEEVKLHWANADQYYIKTSEYLRDYTFKLSDGRRVHFKLVEADTEADNKKPANGQERRFILCPAEPLLESDGELVIRFEYRPDPEKRKQADLNALAAQQIFASPGAASGSPSPGGEGRGEGGTVRHWLPALAAKMPTEKNPDRTLLEKHLADYTARNSFDYFIHKDIGGFLRRELDFFIKNEIMHLDDIEDEQAPRVEQYLAKVKAIRAIARKIIAFLEQLENFQKKLWLKKKFVVETNYCVTLDRVAEALYPEIVASDAQRSEWVSLFAIDEIQADLAKPGYSVPLTVEFLKANPFLVLDTKFFSSEFKQKLLAANKLLCGAATLDEATAGLLIHSESFQALSLLQARLHGQVKCIYTDPPYNTGNDGFTYKDSYQHSTWLSMFRDRVLLSKSLLEPRGLFWCSLDDNESARCKLLLDSLFEPAQFVSDVTVVNNLKGRQDRAHIATAHEHVLLYSNPEGESYGLPLSDDRLAAFDEKDEGGQPYELRDLRRRGGGDRREDRPNMFFPIFWNQVTKRAALERQSADDIEISPKRSDGSDGRWRWGVDRVRENLSILEAAPTPEGNKWNVNYRVYLSSEDGTERTSKPKSVWLDPKYSTDVAGKTLKSILPGSTFSSPKAVGFLTDILHHSTSDADTVLDFTGGTGTTGQAALEVGREDNAQLRYVLVEMGDHFSSDLLPRLQKVIYSKDWKEGKPVSREGSSHLFKYLRLESYEDALNNLELKRTPDQDDLLRQHEPLREDYMLRYQLDVETRDSASLLNLSQFTNPFAYRLKIATGSVGESRPVNVDLVETFNYLLGLRVGHMDTIRGFRVVQGLNPDGEKVLVIWRNVAEKPNAELDTFFQKQGYNTKDLEFALIYVNGDNNLENLKRPDETWKVRRIEDEFKRLMFDVQDV